MEETLNKQALERARALGFSTFSAYVVQLIRNDLIQRGDMRLHETPAADEAKDKQPDSQPSFKAPRSKKKS